MFHWKAMSIALALFAAPVVSHAGSCGCEKCSCHECKDGKCDSKSGKCDCKSCHDDCGCHKKEKK